MDVRKATQEDYEELVILLNGFVEEDRYSKHDNDSIKEVLNSSSNFLFVAEDESKIVGFASVSVRRVIRYPRPIAELDELYVSPESRKQGVGKLLMSKVIEQVRSENCYRLYIESAYKHEIAHKFYESLGFTNYGYHFMKNL